MKKIIIVLTLVVVVTLVIVIGINFFKPDELKGDNLDELFSSTTTTNSNISQTTENTSTIKIDSAVANENEELTPEEMVAATTHIPSYAISWNVEDVVEYNGGEVTMEVTLTNGSFKMEEGFSISLNGVLQECVIECDGKKTESSIMPTLIFKEGQERTFKITFTPNIGKKGQTLEMSLIYAYMPNYRVTDDMEIKVIMGNQNSVLSGSNKKLKINADSTSENIITDSFSGAKVGKLNDVLYTSHYYENVEGDIFNDTYEDNRIALYNEFDKVYTVSEGVFYDNVEYLTQMTVPRAEKTSVTINMYGKPGKRRVCLLINNKLQPVFDGKYYADVELKEGQQVELFVDIDTSDLEKYNCIYVLSKELNGDIDPLDHHLNQLQPYVLIVQ